MADRSVLVRLRADVSDFVAKSQLAKAAVRDLHNEIDKSNDRTAWLAQGILALIPAVTRLGAGAVPVLSGIATQLTIGVAAAGTAAIAFNGIGDALGALQDYQLEPTEERLKKLNETMSKIGPDGQAFVQFLDSLGPALSQLSNSARGGIFPGVIEGIEDFMRLAPELNVIVREIGEGLGELTADAGAGLAGPKFESFFEYLENRAKPILVEMGQTLGNFTLGLLNMMVAFDPLTDDFSKGLLDMSRSFVEWSEGLQSSTGFQEFVDYVREAGPDALDFLGSLINALVEVTEAAAPVGAVMLPVLTSMLNVLADLANTPLGPITLGFLSLTAAWGRLNAVMAITGSGVMSKATGGFRETLATTRLLAPSLREVGNAAAFALTPTKALQASMASGSQKASETAKSALLARTQVQAFGKAAAPVAGQIGLLAFAMSDVDDQLGLTNTASLALAGTLIGPWGAALGAAAGFALDTRAATKALDDQIRSLDEAASGTDLSVLEAQMAKTAAAIRAAKDEVNDLQNTDGIKDFFGDSISYLTTFGGGEAKEEKLRLLEEAYEDATVARDKLTEAEKRAITEDIRAQDQRNRRDSIVNDIEAETKALEANIAAMREKRAEALRGLNAELDYKASILDARDALKENGATVDENTRKGQENLRALYGMAEAWNGQSDAAKSSKANLRAAREEFIQIAEAMGMGEEKARRLANRLFELPAKVPIEIGVDYETAMAHARAVKRELDSIDRFIPVNIHVSRTGQGGDAPYVSGGVPREAGGTVPGQRYPYGDKMDIRVAPGEEIISNRYGQADKNRAALKAANAGATIGVIGYADGGTAGDKKRPPRGAFGGSLPIGFSNAQLEAMLDAARSQEEAAGRQAEAARIAARAAQDQLEAAEEGAKTADDYLKAVEQQADSFRNSVAGKFSNALTGGGLAGLQQTVARDTNAGRSMDQSLQALIAAGLDPTSALYKELASSEDQQTVNELLAAGPQMIAAMQQQVAERDAVNNARADAAREASFGPLIASAQHSADIQAAILHRAEIESVAAQNRSTVLDNRLAGLTDKVDRLADQIADKLSNKVGGRR